MNYYEVVAKCGHVGRDYYYEGHFFIAAYSAKIAASIVLKKPRVKKNHGDAILQVNEVDKLTYEEGLEAMRQNPYFNCRSKREQAAFTDILSDGIKPETDRQLSYRERKCKHYKDKRYFTEKTNKKGIRNPYKYAKYNGYFNNYDLVSV